MHSIRFNYLGFGALLIGCAAAAPACSSSDKERPPAGTGGFSNGGVAATGGLPPGSGGAPPAAGGVPPGNGGTPPGNGGTPPGSGGTTVSTGGVPVTVGGQSNVSDIKIVGTATQCTGTTPDIPPGQLATCVIEKCTAAHCVSAADLAPGTDTTLLPKCPDQSFCTPDDFIATDGKFLLKKCVSLEAAEGRCLSTCIPSVASQIDTLPKDTCADSERCAPCWNPIDGADTKACSQGCDTGPPATKVVFAKCGADKGICVPKALVPADFTGSVPQDTCKTDYVCAPTEKAKNFDYNFPACTPTSLGGILGQPAPNGQKGGCVPAYIIPADQQSLLLQDGCPAGEICAPCTNPLSMPTANAPTGACPTK
jgi:hypothetical protein